MASAQLAKRKNEADDLFKQIKIEGYVIKPWTLTQFVNLSPILKQLVESLKDNGIDVNKEDLLDFDLNKDLTFTDFMGYITKTIGIVGPVLPYLISVSVRIELKDAEEIEWGPSLAIVAHILQFNWNHIKNWAGQILGKDLNQVLADLRTKLTN